jgi:hypothetical protein
MAAAAMLLTPRNPHFERDVRESFPKPVATMLATIMTVVDRDEVVG